jgi:hypothetical protein
MTGKPSEAARSTAWSPPTTVQSRRDQNTDLGFVSMAILQRYRICQCTLCLNQYVSSQVFAVEWRTAGDYVAHLSCHCFMSAGRIVNPSCRNEHSDTDRIVKSTGVGKGILFHSFY